MSFSRLSYEDEFQDMLREQEASRPPGQVEQAVGVFLRSLKQAQITASQPAHIKPTVWSQPIDLSTRVTVPAAVGPYVTAITYVAPPGRAARIASYGVQVLDPAYTYDGSILWRISIDGRPVGDGLSDWGIQRGTIFQPRETFFVLNQEHMIEFQVRRAVAAPGPQDVDMALQGWSWLLRNTFEGTDVSVTAY